MFLGIQRFQVDDEKIDELKQRLDDTPVFWKARSFYGKMNVALFDPSGQLQRKNRMKQRIATADSDAAATIAIERFIGKNFAQDVIKRHFLPNGLAASGKADVDAAHTTDALAAVEFENLAPARPLYELGASGRTNGSASSAAYTAITVVIVFLGYLLGFRVVTPRTFQGASLKEHGCPEAWTVLKAEPLYFGYQRNFHTPLHLGLEISVWSFSADFPAQAISAGQFLTHFANAMDWKRQETRFSQATIRRLSQSKPQLVQTPSTVVIFRVLRAHNAFDCKA